MPACIVENENDGSVKTRAGLSREGFEQRLEERLRDAIMHIPEGFACRGRHEGGYIEPVKAVMTKGDRPLADLRPDAPRYGLQAEPMLVACENFDGPIGVFFRFLDDGVRELFLNAASSSGVADFGFFGRGAWIDQPSAFSASQPRCGLHHKPTAALNVREARSGDGVLLDVRRAAFHERPLLWRGPSGERRRFTGA